MRKLTILLIVVCWFFWALTQIYADQGTDHLITPGKGIGSVRIGMTLDALKAALGPEDIVSNDGARLYYSWKTESGFLAAFVFDSKIAIAQINHDPRYATAEGVRTGMARDEVLNVMGKPSQTSTKDVRIIHEDRTETRVSVEVLDYRGIEVWIPMEDLPFIKAGTVSHITVW